jgi:hypothetical protein
MKSYFLRSYALGVAAALITIPGYVAVQAQASPQPTTLYSADAELTHALNSNNAKMGQAVTAKLTNNVSAGSVNLPKGTVLLGKVDQVQKESNGGTTLGIVFDRAQVSKGHEIAIKATLLGAYPPPVYDDEAGYQGSGLNMTAQPATVASDHTVQQDAGTLNGVSLTSAVKSDLSGVFASSDRDIKLQSGTRLQVAIAPGNSAGNPMNGN